MKRILVSAQRHLSIFIIKVGFNRKGKSVRHLRLGTDYGGWWVPEVFLNQENRKLLISAGLGHDVSFEKEMLNFGFEVVGLDPLPECVEYAKVELSNYKKISLINKGLWISTGKIDFYSPPSKNSDAYSITNSHFNENAEILQFEVITLVQLQQQFLDDLIDEYELVVLKLDIEGAEIQILSDYLSGPGKKLDFLAVELDSVSLIPFWKFGERFAAIILARKFMKQLSELGYVLTLTDGYNFHWITRNKLSLVG
ncbi:Methyltransferase FkbM [Candidatus Planktophila versatilis]